MLVMIITLITAVAFYNNLISPDIFISIVIGTFLLALLTSCLYIKFGWLAFWYHDVLGWHEPDDSPQWYDMCNHHARCKYCGKEIMQDSQGNWF